jgi:serine/threonine protein kinase
MDTTTNIDRATRGECPKQPAFKIECNKRIYFFQVAPKEIDSWVNALKTAIKRLPPADPSEPKKVSLEDFELLRVIARRSWGKVQLVRYIEDGRLYAMKSLRKAALLEAGQVENAVIEANLLKQTKHPFLVCAHHAFQTEDKLFLVLDYVPGGALFTQLRKEQRFAEPRARLYAAEILLGIGHLHKQHAVNRDLKPENILVDEHGHLRITDFRSVKTDMDADTTTSTFTGTPEYIAPEILQGRRYTAAVDWWSFGILLYEMLAGLTPFLDENVNRMYRHMIYDPVQFPDYFSAEAKDLIEKLLEKDPANRLGAGESDYEPIKAHPFFAPIDFDRLMKREIPAEWKPSIKGELDVGNLRQSVDEDAANVAVLPPSAAGNSLYVDGFSQGPDFLGHYH